MAYVNWLAKAGDALSLNFSREKIALDHAAHFRVSTSPDLADLAAFKGEVDVETPSGKVAVEKKKTATFDATDNDKYTLANNIEEAPLDSWDKESIAYHDQSAKNNSSPYGYGVADMNYYGSYSNVPGYGMMWQPFFTGIGWNPFMDGAWSWYPGYGYMFASAYPWGWMPYRYGNWMFVPNFGWMWQAGGFNTWGTVPRFAGALPVNFHPLVAPATGTIKTVAVGKGGAVSALDPSRMIIHSGTAGLGISRGSVGNLHHLNSQVAKNGSAEVHAAPQFASSSSAMPGYGQPSHPSMSAAPTVHSSSTSHAPSSGHH
jgi:uncharacterized protein DUF6600